MLSLKRKELRKVLKKTKWLYHSVNEHEFTCSIDGQWVIVKHEHDGELVDKLKYDDIDLAINTYIEWHDSEELTFHAEVEAEVLNRRYF